ncbi:uncharacterized protein LOC121727254 isoform X3 [Aricia agestis]|uniref:uncharacterized protein LOC121727254 isoform X3 n=1 Tax=Aricia agestis TaxID=91739 RepID=UPI001C20449A|nr:uncharacterized protein LOC121727254 isoform X3 [Aricia agestis]
MPDKPRRRKNNKNKRKNNRNNKSEQSPNKVSANDIENIVECVNDEVGQSNVTADLENSLEKISNEVKEFSTALNSNETKPENKIPENESQKTAGPSNESPCNPVDSSVKKTEDEVDCACYDKKEKITDDLNSNNIPNLSKVSDTQIGNTITSEQKEIDVDILNKRDESHVEYLVESPDQKAVHNPKLSNNVKSKSVDNDDSPTITEVTEEIEQNNENDASLSIIDCKNAIITDADSDIEWQKTDDLKDSDVSYTSDAKILPVTSIPLNTAQCNKANILKSEDEISLRNFLQTLNLSANPDDSNTLEIRAEIEHIINREIKHRLRKRGLAEDLVFQRGPSRSLTVIDEEGSSESSATSRRQSYLSEKASDTDELEDDVFENKFKAGKDQRGQIRPAHRVYPTFQTIPQECIRVDAKIKEPEITEARGSWAMKQTETLTGAELVYLTDSSSSTSSVYDLNDDKETAEDNDVAVRIITPTIEVTDAEKLLTNSCLMKQETDKKDHKIENKVVTKVPNDTVDISTQNNKHINPHEIVIESIDNIETNLYVKEIPNDSSPILENKINDSDLIKTNENCPKIANKYDLEMKVIKCELNDAINNLIKEVTSDSECVQSENLLQRQDSSSSLGSSQCTAKYNPNHSSLNDVADIISENHIEPYTHVTHVKEVYERAVTDKNDLTNKTNSKAVSQPYTLKEVCLQKITSLPYGDKIIEELANVSECLQNMSLQNATESKKILESHSDAKNNIPERSSIPPPIQPRTSSFKITKDEYNQEFLPTPGRNIRCVSPSNKMLMEKTNTVIKDDKPRFSLPTQNNLKHTDDNYFIHRDNNKTYQMKSETGSRLLSLLRDTSVKSNSSPFLYKSNTNDNLEKLSKIGFSENFRQYAKGNKCTVSQFESHEKYKSDTFRPLPSPKLRSFSSSFYESDDSSDITENTLRKMHNEKRYFHYSTGTLNKDIENDVSSIQNMHRHYINVRDKSQESRPRRPSLPKDLCDQQMEYIRQKEKEVDAELERLQRENTSLKNKRSPKAPMIAEESFERRTLSSYKKPLIKEVHSTRTDKKQMSSIFSSSEEELRREKMYSEYVSQMAEREKRREHKVIKITKPSPIESAKISKSTTALDSIDRKVNNPIEGEFISKARERWNKLGIMDPETEDEKEQSDVYREPKVIEHKIKVIDAGEEKDVKRLPNHLQEFVSFTVKDTDRKNSPETVMITPTFKARSSSPVVWRPGAPAAPVRSESSSTPGAPPPPPPPVWSPSSAPSPQSQRKTFRPVHFEESPPPRRKASAENGCLSGSDSEGRLKTSHSAPVTGLNTLGLSTNSRLPRAQNPTVTLLQKAREGLLQQTNIIQQERDARLPRDRPSPPRGDPVYALRAEYDASEGDGRRSKMSDGHKKVDGIGPTTKDGMPVTLRSEVKDPSRWYKKMYDTIHKNKYDGETIQRPSSNRSQYAYFDPRSGYLSEPEGRRVPSAWSDYDSDATGPRRRTASVQEERRNESPYMTNKYSTLASARASQEVYKGQPGRIENYVPGRSSVIDKEAKQWWDEVMDIFDGWLDENAPLPPYTTFLARAIQKNQRNMSNSSLPQASPKEKKDITSTILSKSNMARALKESGYESDSTLIFRRREETDGPLSPAERRAAYRDLQAGGEPPLRGFRSPAPPRQEGESAPEPPRRSAYGSYSDTESPNRRYVESDVNIHYRCPVRRDPLPLVPERELARQQAEHMKSLYREQKRNKYLQDNNIDPRDIEAFDASMKELQDAQNRRHQDNFMPSQKLVIPPNRYDEAEKIVARALYTFNGQTSRELSFRKGDFISVRRQIDANWYEGEIHGRIGLFPYNYVELLKGDGSRSPRRSAVIEGRAKAKFDFTAQTNLELPLKKGEIVTLTRRIDQNWWEGRNGHKTGIFPDSYVTVLQEPSQSKPESQPILNTDKPVASPAAHGLLNGSDKRSMGTHSYTPQQNSSALANAPPATQPLPGYAVSKNQRTVTPSDRGYGPPTGAGVDLNNTEPLYVDTNAEAIPYRAMYKYRPQNPDELELSEGDTVYVLEKCDDGWYVGSSQRTGRFGTFPGNYVERI